MAGSFSSFSCHQFPSIVQPAVSTDPVTSHAAPACSIRISTSYLALMLILALQECSQWHSCPNNIYFCFVAVQIGLNVTWQDVSDLVAPVEVAQIWYFLQVKISESGHSVDREKVGFGPHLSAPKKSLKTHGNFRVSKVKRFCTFETQKCCSSFLEKFWVQSQIFRFLSCKSSNFSYSKMSFFSCFLFFWGNSHFSFSKYNDPYLPLMYGKIKVNKVQSK